MMIIPAVEPKSFQWKLHVEDAESQLLQTILAALDVDFGDRF